MRLTHANLVFGLSKLIKKSIEQVWKINEKEKVYVLCKINRKARDPVKVSTKPYYAKKAYGPTEKEFLIPNGIETSFTEGKNYQAYVVSKYKLLNQSIV